MPENLKLPGKDQVAALPATHLEEPRPHLSKAVAAVKCDRPGVSRMSAQQQPAAAQSAGIRQGSIHQRLGRTKIGDDPAVGVQHRSRAKTREEIDALQLHIRGQNGERGQLRGADQNVAHH